jgi:hypothetical protein
MIRQLDRLSANAEVRPEKDSRCLVCHSMKHAAPADENVDVLSDGVGCESCHGPASEWVGEHFQYKLTPEDRGRLGMWNTDRLLTRTQICVECHVGGPGREVDHDLIAAGHPRLQFEMGAYFAALPKHWKDSEDRANHGNDFDAKLWALGQVSASQAALEQLARRAEPAGASPHIWPEFSEWSCSACHHDLRDNPAIQQRVAGKQALSGRSIDWDSWNHFMTRGRTQRLSAAFELNKDPQMAARAQVIDSNFGILERQMRQLNPKRQQVADLARRTASELELLAAGIEGSPITLPRLEHVVSPLLTAETAAADWSTAAQTYNALATVQEARLRSDDARGEALHADVEGIYSALKAAQKTPDKNNAAFDPVKLSGDFEKAGRQLSPEDGSQ